MKSRVLVAVAAACTIVLAAVAPAVAITPPTLDQHHECAATDCNVNQTLYPTWLSPQTPIPANSSVGLAQVFTAGMTGPLDKVELYLEIVDSGTPTPFDVSIVPLVGGIPQPASALATQTVTPTANTSPWGAIGNPAWIPVTFTTPATVTAGTHYAILVGWAAPAGAWLYWETDASWGSNGYSGYTDYAGGEAMTGTHVLAAYNFYDLFQLASVNASQQGNADFAFRTYVGAAAPVPTPTAPAPTPTAPAPTPTAPAPTPTAPAPTPQVTQPPTDTAITAAPAQQAPAASLIVLALAGLAGAVAVLAPRRLARGNRR